MSQVEQMISCYKKYQKTTMIYCDSRQVLLYIEAVFLLFNPYSKTSYACN